MEEEIKEMDGRVRECNVRASRSKGVERWIELKFAAFFSWAGDLGREIQREEQRGENDNYHDEY